MWYDILNNVMSYTNKVDINTNKVDITRWRLNSIQTGEGGGWWGEGVGGVGGERGSARADFKGL